MTVVKSDLFTGANGDPWNPAIWTTTGIDSGATLDLQVNRGRMASGTTPYASVAASLQPGVQNYELSYKFAIPSAGEWYHFVQLRGGTLANPGPRGLPSAYEVRFVYYAPNASFGINFYEIDGAGTKTYRDGGDFLGGLIPPGTFVRVKVLISGNQPTLTLKMKVWPDGTAEPALYTLDVGASATVNNTGANFALVLQGGADTTTDVLLVDDFAIDDLGATGTLAVTERDDTLAASGLLPGGSFARIEANDTLAAIGTAGGATATSSALQNPAHTYVAPGTYLVQLTSTNAQGWTTTSRIVTVLDTVVTPPPVTATPTGTVFLLASLMTGQVIDELECSSFSFDEVLNRPGTWQATIPLRPARPIGAELVEGARSVWVVRDAEVLFGGVLWQRATAVDEDGSDVINLAGEGFFSLYRDGRRTVRSRSAMSKASGVLATDVTWGTNVDLFAIVEDLFAHAAAIGGAADFGFPIERNGPGVDGYSGVYLDGALTFTTDERKGIGELVEELTEREPGIDFGLRYRFTTPASTPAVIEPVLELNYPMRGQHTAYVLESGKNIASIDYASDGAQLANYLDGFGAGDGATMVRATVEDAAQRYPAGPYPLLEGSVTNKSAMSPRYLRGLLAQQLVSSVHPIETAGLTLTETAEIPVGTLHAGDFVTVDANDGYLTLTGSWRIGAVSTSFDEDGASTVQVDLAAAALYGG